MKPGAQQLKLGPLSKRPYSPTEFTSVSSLRKDDRLKERSTKPDCDELRFWTLAMRLPGAN
jgi:hypothetical protein